MTLPRTSDLGRDLSVAHLVTARYGERVISFEGHVEVSGGVFRLAVLDPLGRKALTARWSDDGVVYDAATFFPAELPPQNILADLVLIYWPPAALQRSLVSARAEFEATSRERVVRHDGHEVIRADFTPGRVFFRNLAFGYSLDIRTAEPAP